MQDLPGDGVFEREKIIGVAGGGKSAGGFACRDIQHLSGEAHLPVDGLKLAMNDDRCAGFAAGFQGGVRVGDGRWRRLHVRPRGAA